MSKFSSLALNVVVGFCLAGCHATHSTDPTPSAAPSVSLSVQPASVASGASATLSWSSSNATSVSISPGIGAVGTSGSTMVAPSSTTTYVAQASGPSGTTSASATLTVNSQPASEFGHVVIVVEENRTYGMVIGSASMPYLNSLAQTYGLATNYYANTHPSIGNYFELTTGQVVTNDQSFQGTVTQDNVVRELVAAGKTWKCYAESLPSAGYLGKGTPPYDQGHNPFVFFSDVQSNPAQQQNIVPFTQFALDLQSSQLPQYSFIIPNDVNDGHNSDSSVVDAWLKTNIAPLVADPNFQKDGLLIITYDESLDSDIVNGGGHIATVIISPKAKPAYQSTTLYQHQSVVRLMLEGLGVPVLPGGSATAPDMLEFFNP